APAAPSAPAATPAPTPSAPAPTAAAAPAGIAPSAAAPAAPAPTATPIRAGGVQFGDLFATRELPGGPKIPVDTLLKDKSVQAILKFSVNAQPLWTRAKYGGDVVALTTLGGALSNPVLDPLRGAGRRNHYYGRLLYYDQGLCSWVGREDFSVCKGQYAVNNGIVIVPGIFEKWRQPDPVTYVFTVRKGVLWPAIPPVIRPDREVTAEDIKWFLETTKQEGQLKDSFADMKSAEAVDRYTLRIVTAAPLPDFLRNIAQSGVGIFPKECYDAGTACMGQKLITPGPWLLKEYIVRQRAVLEKNQEFFLKGLPYVDRWTWLNITDPSAAKAAFVSGQVINFRTFTQDDAEATVKLVPGSTLTVQVSAASGFGMRPKLEGPLADVNVRRALMLALDLRTIWELSSGGLGILATEFGRDLFGLGQSVFLSMENASEWYQYNPTRAKKMLTDAGFPNGFTTSVITASSSGQGYDMLLAIQSQWKKNVGVDMAIKVVDSAASTASLTGKKWDGFHNSFGAGAWSDGLTGFLTRVKGSPFNYQDIDDPVINDLFMKANREMDPVKRVALLWQAEQHEMNQVYILRFNHVWPWDAWQSTEINGATHAWDFYYSLGVMWMTMQDPTRARK
ncbi:MAG: ABC transporter substrate-binding protein, partial [SAR202 cluster bacterium]|nr:ABC transporter substrate-binding protein [SAR202 cluster bacterium]